MSDLLSSLFYKRAVMQVICSQKIGNLFFNAFPLFYAQEQIASVTLPPLLFLKSGGSFCFLCSLKKSDHE